MWVLPEMKSTSPRTPRKLFCQPSWSLSQELSHLFLYSCNYFISKSHFIQCMAFRDPHVQDVGSSLKSATWLPLPRARRRPPCDTWHRSFHPDGNSHSLHPDGNSARPTFHFLRIFLSRRLPPTEREVRFNFSRQTCPNPLVMLIWITPATDDSDSLGSLASQTLVTRRIHFCPQSKSKLRQY